MKTLSRHVFIHNAASMPVLLSKLFSSVKNVVQAAELFLTLRKSTRRCNVLGIKGLDGAGGDATSSSSTASEGGGTALSISRYDTHADSGASALVESASVEDITYTSCWKRMPSSHKNFASTDAKYFGSGTESVFSPPPLLACRWTSLPLNAHSAKRHENTLLLVRALSV